MFVFLKVHASCKKKTVERFHVCEFVNLSPVLTCITSQQTFIKVWFGFSAGVKCDACFPPVTVSASHLPGVYSWIWHMDILISLQLCSAGLASTKQADTRGNIGRFTSCDPLVQNEFPAGHPVKEER